MESKGLDIFDPAFIMAIILAFISDLVLFFSILALAIPLIGLVALFMAIMAHYLAAFFVALLVFPKITKGTLLSNIKGVVTADVGSALLLLAKIFLGLVMILPVPLLTIGIVVAIVIASKFVRFAAEIAVNVALLFVAPEAVAAKAAAAGAKAAGVVERGAVAAERAAATGARAEEAAAGAARGTEAAEATEEAMGVKKGPLEKVKELMEKMPEAEERKEEEPEEAIEAPRAPAKKTEGAPPPGPEVSGEALGEEPTPFEKLEKLTKEPLPPEEEGEENEELPKAA